MLGIVTDSRVLILANAPSPITVTPSGIISVLTFEQDWNALSLISFRELDNVMVVTFSQPVKAYSPTEVTEFGNVIDSRASH